ncbi:AgmX/PglI C-terminal domain-containing protein [Myxococcaceae bacterium GXIMD 01537]
MSGQPSVLQVVILRDGLLVGTEVFVPGAYAIGSDPGSDLRLEDPSVAPRHAQLYFQNGRAAIQDAGSGGVYVNGHRVSACEIRPVDEVMCGPFVLKTRVLQQRPQQEVKQAPPPELAALLNPAAQPPPQPVAPPQQPAAPVRQLRPAAPPQPLAATVPGVRPPPPAAHAPSLVDSFAATVAGTASPLASPPPAAAAPQPAVAPAVAPITYLHGAPSTPPSGTQAYGQAAAALAQPASSTQVFGNGAVARPLPPPEPSLPPPPPMPSSTMPSVRRRPASEGPEDRGMLLADELLADLALDGTPLETGSLEGSSLTRPALTRPTHAPRIGGGKGAAQLYLELYWGAVRREARRFAPGKRPVVGSAHEAADMPLWGFQLPEGGAPIAQSVNGTWRVLIPADTQVEKSGLDGRFAPVIPAALEADGTRRFITLREGTAARLTQGAMSLVAYAAPVPERVYVSPLKGLPWLVLACFGVLAAGMGAFLVLKPSAPETADFTQKSLPPVALRLIAPDVKKKEEVKKKLETLKKTEPKKEKVVEKPVTKVVEKVQQKQETQKAAPVTESRALKALSKLSAAGTASNDLLAAVDKLGSGPGSKNAKTSNFKLSGLIGKAPLVNAGTGTFGLGGGGKGGGATLGAELLRGKGGGGIGALGAGGVGKGAVGGTVTRATARSIAAQGSIDREGVAKVVNSHLQEVHACYERALLREPGLAGKVVLEWTIATNGRVVAAKTKSSTLRNSAVEACILTALKSWTFPPATGGNVIITYPFLFNSVGY